MVPGRLGLGPMRQEGVGNEMDAQQRKQVGGLIFAARKARGWGRQRLADEAGVGSENTIKKMEEGEEPTNPNKLRLVCDALDVAYPEGDTLVLEGLSIDARKCLRVAAATLSTAGEEREMHLLIALWTVLGDFLQNGTERT